VKANRSSARSFPLKASFSRLDTHYSFICQVRIDKETANDLFGLRVNLPPVTTMGDGSGRQAVPTLDFHTWYKYSR